MLCRGVVMRVVVSYGVNPGRVMRCLNHCNNLASARNSSVNNIPVAPPPPYTPCGGGTDDDAAECKSRTDVAPEADAE